jgi:hypothetical protein
LSTNINKFITLTPRIPERSFDPREDGVVGRLRPEHAVLRVPRHLRRPDPTHTSLCRQTLQEEVSLSGKTTFFPFSKGLFTQDIVFDNKSCTFSTKTFWPRDSKKVS